MKHTSIRLQNGKLLDLSQPLVMGIMNVTPDSFFSGSRLGEDEQAIRQRAQQIVNEGAAIIDLGAYSSRSSAEDLSPAEEMKRLQAALKILKSEFKDVPLSVDTFRADVAKMCVEEYGVDIINDISGGNLDENMYATVAQLQVPYILMHMRGTPATMQSLTDYDNLGLEVLDYFIERIGKLRELGLHDLILDPGYGFSKTTLQNYELMAQQEELLAPLELPILVGISRKSMIYKLLGSSPEQALNGSTVLHSYSLMHGADILRVHDVREAVEACKIVACLKSYEGEQR